MYKTELTNLTQIMKGGFAFEKCNIGIDRSNFLLSELKEE